jgi:hypothetical protein
MRKTAVTAFLLIGSAVVAVGAAVKTGPSGRTMAYFALGRAVLGITALRRLLFYAVEAAPF